MQKKLSYFTIIMPLLLNACAGGGKVDLPVPVVPYPKTEAIDFSKGWQEAQYQNTNYITPVSELEHGKDAGKIQAFNTSTNDKGSANNGYATIYNVKVQSTKSRFNDDNKTQDDTRFIYKANSGKYYPINASATLSLPTYATPKEQQYIPTSHDPEITSEGKIVACCINADESNKPASVGSDLIYGAWIKDDGSTNLFATGVMADLSKMQGAWKTGKPTGKAIYDVIGFRVNNGKVVSSTYSTLSRTEAPDAERSMMIANFNTGKIGGKLIGNADFGDSIDFYGENNAGSLDINGTEFSGTAKSGSEIGQVKGAFFGQHNNDYYPDGSKIGGIVTFENKKELNASFGGGREANNTSDDSTDTLPQWKSYSGDDLIKY